MLKSSKIELAQGECQITLNVDLPAGITSIGSADVEVKPTEFYDMPDPEQAFAEIRIILTWPPPPSVADIFLEG